MREQVESNVAKKISMNNLRFNIFGAMGMAGETKREQRAFHDNFMESSFLEREGSRHGREN